MAKNNMTNASQQNTLETAIYAGGCFWGVEHMMKKQKGVVSAESGYIGGFVENPTYEQVCTGTTGHAEAVKIVFDTSVTSYEIITKYFFEIHDPTQIGGQGPDMGEQYRSEIFYSSDKQKNVVVKLIDILKSKGLNVVTKISPATTFYKAENHHQKHYENQGTLPYCHIYLKRF
ncbi:MAG: peptide-methionine (S)-S-oxide reductase MsrA [Bacteroidota bacterium]|nr:peptide-methionine (S)-S-oxide reductase MsrA [Bacteroidota bacterium]